MSRYATSRYKPTEYGGANNRSVCMWPGCPIFAYTEIRSSLVWGDGKTWIALCHRHRAAYDSLSLTDLRATNWAARRKRWI